jgi:CheY-like chemotaxis protein
MKTVLVAEDNELFRRMLEGFLTTAFPSLKFIFAPNADTALRETEQLTDLYCLVTDNDLGRDQDTGVQLAEKVRRRFPDVKIILVSSYVSSELRDTARRHNIEHCAFKFDGLQEWSKLLEP